MKSSTLVSYRIPTGSVLVLDNSAWTRLITGVVPQERAHEVAGWMADEQLAVCVPFLLEAGYSARSARDRKQLMSRLSHLPRIEIDSEVEQLALSAQRELAAMGHHRLAPMDLLLAACAHCGGADVLHYDRDYDVIAEHTSLSFNSVWLVPAGSA